MPPILTRYFVRSISNPRAVDAIGCHHRVLGYDFHHALYPHSPRTSGAFESHFDWQVTRMCDNISHPDQPVLRANGSIMPRSGCGFYSQKSISNCTQKSQHFPQYRTMGDLRDGYYFIVLATPSAPPPLPVGADEDKPASPVIVGGKDNIVSS